MNTPSQVLDALFACHKSRLETTTCQSTIMTTSGQNTDFLGERIASCFANTVSSALSQPEYDRLLSFLHRITDKRSVDVHMEGGIPVQDMILQFYQKEKDIAHSETNTMCLPVGREDAEMVLLLHCQTGNTSSAAEFRPFWDEGSYTIKTLMAKGLNSDFLFGYDWHWRGETSCIGRGNCHARKWPRALRELHDSFSGLLFNILPSPFALVGGACAKESLRSSLAALPNVRLHSLSVPFCSSTGLELDFDLVFKAAQLVRIILYIPHPSAVYFEREGPFQPISFRLDAACNFFLWILGKSHNPFSFQQRAVGQSLTVRAAPIAQMHWYCRREKREGNPLKFFEYDPKFLIWAMKYLGKEINLLVSSRKSIVRACADKMSGRAWAARIKNFVKRRTNNGVDGSITVDGPVVDLSGEMSPSEIKKWTIEINRDLGSRKRTTRLKKSMRRNGPSSSTVKRLEMMIQKTKLSNKAETVVKVDYTAASKVATDSSAGQGLSKPVRSLIDGQNLSKPVRFLIDGQGLSKPVKSSIDGQGLSKPVKSSIDVHRTLNSDQRTTFIAQTLRSLHQLSPSETPVASPLTTSLLSPISPEILRTAVLGYDSLAIRPSPADLNHLSFLLGPSIQAPQMQQNRETFFLTGQLHSEAISRGIVPQLEKSNGLTALTTTKDTDSLVDSTFPSTVIPAKTNDRDEDIHYKMNNKLNMKLSGGSHKKNTKKKFRLQSDVTTMLKMPKSSTPSSRTSSNLRSLKINNRRRQELLSGFFQRCANGGAGARFGRVALRDQLFVHVPETANFDAVWIWCDLRNKEVKHPEGCSFSAEENDPAQRLGIFVEYTLKGTNTSEQFWFKVKSERDLKKINTLVDFLDGQSYEFTANQKRRFVSLRKGSNSRPSYYT